MARSPNAVAAQDKVKVKRQTRPLGPRTLWIVLKPGTDAAAMREQIESVTFNGREVLKSMGTGETPAVIKMQIASEKREKGVDVVELGSDADAPFPDADTTVGAV